MLTLKHLLPKWVNTYGTGEAPNDGYKTIGLLVPIEDFEKHCYTTDTITGDDNGL